VAAAGEFPTSQRNPQALLPAEALHALVIDPEALPDQQHLQSPIPVPRMRRREVP